MLRMKQAVGLAAAAALLAPAAAQAQFESGGYKFLQAVRDQNASDVLDALNKGGPNILNSRDDKRETVLHITAREQNCGWLSDFLRRGADANAQNNAGETPLLISVQAGASDCVAYLLAAGARPDLGDRFRQTPLILAVHRHDLDLATRLLKAGADPDQADNSGKSARIYATESQRDAAILRAIQDTPRRASRGVAGPKLR